MLYALDRFELADLRHPSPIVDFVPLTNESINRAGLLPLAVIDVRFIE
jgi:hypothetical protein